mgnify:CR=1 FL=1
MSNKYTVRVFKTRLFDRWAKGECIADNMLLDSIEAMESGLINASLGGHVYKQRVALSGQGKRGGARTIIAFKVKDKAFFIYGFAKNKRDNIRKDELTALKAYARELLAYSDFALSKAVYQGVLIEVINHE